MKVMGILRGCALGLVLLLAASVPCFADATQLNLNFSGLGGGLGGGLPPTGGSIEFQVFDPIDKVQFVTLSFSFGPATSCDEFTADGLFSSSCLFGRGGSIQIDLISFNGSTTTYTGIILSGDSTVDRFDANTGTFQDLISEGTFTLNGFKGVGSFSDSDTGENGTRNLAVVTFSGTATPEPGTLALLGTGLLGLGPFVRRGLQAHRRR